MGRNMQNPKIEKYKKIEFQLFIMQFNLILSKPSPKQVTKKKKKKKKKQQQQQQTKNKPCTMMTIHVLKSIN
jgi:hypothetical protein